MKNIILSMFWLISLVSCSGNIDNTTETKFDQKHYYYDRIEKLLKTSIVKEYANLNPEYSIILLQENKCNCNPVDTSQITDLISKNNNTIVLAVSNTSFQYSKQFFTTTFSHDEAQKKGFDFVENFIFTINNDSIVSYSLIKSN